MAIKKYKSKKNNKRNNKNKRTGSKSKKLFAKHSKKTRAHRKTISRYSKSHNSKKKHNMKGGFSSCGLATVKEPSFSIPDIGSVLGLSIPEGRAAIFRPNCNTSSNQAMVP